MQLRIQMRTAMDDHGNLLFAEKDCLQSKQVKSLVSSMDKNIKKPWQKRIVSEIDFGWELTEEVETEDEDDNEI